MEKELTKIGYISKSFGFKGDLKATLEVIQIDPSFPKFIWIYFYGKPVPFYLEKVEIQKQNYIFKIEDVNDEDSSQVFKNKSIYCAKSIFDEYFEEIESIEGLIGFQVSDSKQGSIGIVSSIIENSIQPTLVLLLNETEILIPYTDEIIIELDKENKKILVNTPEGLIDLYTDDNQ